MMVADFADSRDRERNFMRQMRWTPRGAHLSLQVRVQALNDDLPAVLQRWYPDLGHCREQKLAA
jgi:hypothetical protein